MNKPLAGISILVTRPAHQAGDLAARIHAAGGTPILFPVLEILDTKNQRSLLDLLARLNEFDLAIFISPNAVNKTMSLICAKRTWPPKLKVAAVGQGTARELRRFGVDEVIAPTLRFDSEGLLDMDELQQVDSKRIVIFRGDNGRELLGEELLKRGATLEYAECYRRVKPNTDTAPLLSAWASNEMNAITITSSEGLRNLCDMVGESGQAWLKKTPLFVSHERIARNAKKIGLTQVILTAAGDEGLLQGLLNYFQSETRGEGCFPQRTH
ncbi:MAG: uroporphyrinogen-III synthase [Nitrosospira sp.]